MNMTPRNYCGLCTTTQNGMTMNQTEADKLRNHLQNWKLRNPYQWQLGAAAVAQGLMQDAAFTDIKIANLLETRTGVTITQVVESALPFPAGAEVVVMVEAIEIAANEKRTNRVVGVIAVGGILALVLLAIFG